MAEASSPRAGWGWASLALVLAAGAVLASAVPRETLDWQPALAWREPWRAWSAVFVHYSALHLGANVAGALLVGALGQSASLSGRSVVAWLLAWPLTQFALLVQPALLHYGGLSGVLHAGVAVVAVHLLLCGGGAQRRIGAAIAGVLVLKLLVDAPWQGAVRHVAGWDIAIAPMAHVMGVLAGAMCAIATEGVRKRPPTIDR